MGDFGVGFACWFGVEWKGFSVFAEQKEDES